MEVDSTTDSTGVVRETRIAVHPLAIVHMSDQYTRISSGGSPLDKTAPVVGLLFGFSDDQAAAATAKPTSNHSNSNSSSSNTNANEGPLIEVLDADDIPVEVSETSTLQVDLHKAVFPKHKVVGWYRVVASHTENEEIEPTPEDLVITKLLKGHYASSDSESFCFCLLKVQKESQEDNDDAAMKTEDATTTATDTLNKELPINLYELHNFNNNTVLVGLSNWHLDTSPAEQIAVERVMKEQPFDELGEDGSSQSPSHNPFVLETSAIGHSLTSMKDRVGVLTTYLREIQEGKRPVDHVILRQIQQIVASLGPLSSLAACTNEGEEEELQLLTHLAIVARTVNSMQSYTEKFRLVNEEKTASFKRQQHTSW
eukprot:CAMPEP_0168177384 /NCGR_PEP_ID=MMETSP0139_2-20121125/8417_1 /TAXON_ID=44445 /ORGANISM="Pseudo-nitzschia australis, Strain 10249 10 AB" /LENGTH=369 /DNA_ID=CAMNT_0008096415 /DNA_START=184 /DNA_END=1290 /DNA_ORIENTATION=-